MAIYTHGWESDPRRDGCDSCTDLRAEVDRLTNASRAAESTYMMMADNLNRQDDEIDRQAKEIEYLKAEIEDYKDSIERKMP